MSESDIKIVKKKMDRARKATIKSLISEFPALENIQTSNTRALTIAFIQFVEWMVFIAICILIFSFFGGPYNPVKW